MVDSSTLNSLTDQILKGKVAPVKAAPRTDAKDSTAPASATNSTTGYAKHKNSRHSNLISGSERRPLLERTPRPIMLLLLPRLRLAILTKKSQN